MGWDEIGCDGMGWDEEAVALLLVACWMMRKESIRDCRDDLSIVSCPGYCCAVLSCHADIPTTADHGGSPGLMVSRSYTRWRR